MFPKPVPLAELAGTIEATSKGLPEEKNPMAAQLKEGLVFVSERLPPVPAKVVRKVLRWEFIDLVDLLPKKSS